MAKKNTPDLGKVMAQNAQKGATTPVKGAEIITTTPEAPKFTEEEVQKRVDALIATHKTELGTMDDKVKAEVAAAVKLAMSSFNPGHPKLETNAIMQEVVGKTDSAIAALKDLEKLFEEKGVGKKTMVFKTIPGRRGKRLTLRSRSTITVKGEVIQMLATRSSASPFRIRQPEDILMWAPKIDPIFFVAMAHGDCGMIEIAAHNPCLQAYLLAHPKYGALFLLEDKEADASRRREGILETRKLELELENAYDSGEKLRIMSVGLLGASNAVHMSPDEIFVQMQKRLIENKESYCTEIADAANPFAYSFSKGATKGIIESGRSGMSYKGSVIHNDSSLLSPVLSFTKWATTQKGLYDDLMDKLNEIE